MDLRSDDIRDVFRRTVIVRKPTYGIVSGYHELPYICLGASFEARHQATKVRGRIHVSPRFVIRPPHLEPSYEDIFGEGNVDGALAGRVFGFLGFRDNPVECASDYLELTHLDRSVDELLADTLDELERYEDITTGVIVSPNTRYYPISVERFISSVLKDEFSI